ncbi:hypothetical protein E2C01_057812 [Portunus trituberculatus]|uniref:Uncharacterized protein n=1 Tax=Portunus trituberculatus TaxID=210409 RepID=A0A5B7GUJ0_PORTR|nr:hypothetical protein [Portunus trituberculatus]
MLQAAARRNPSVSGATTAARVSGTAVKAQCEAENLRRVAVSVAGRRWCSRCLPGRCEAKSLSVSSDDGGTC